ncbi:MAG: hypothetical protein QF732_09125 [Nitrospinaceae bacterium]|jgi:hypothetical protein|nr:hypothetical protein [Nitrospinaceae bacterium]
MKTTIRAMQHSRGFQIQFKNGYMLSIGIGGGHYCDNNSKPYLACVEEQHPTSTMEVAIMKNGHFVVLPLDVAGYVPCDNIGPLISAVEAEDWERVCVLCGETFDKAQCKL